MSAKPRTTRHRLTVAQAAELRKLRSNGWGYRRLSARFGISPKSVRWRVKRTQPELANEAP